MRKNVMTMVVSFQLPLAAYAKATDAELIEVGDKLEPVLNDIEGFIIGRLATYRGTGADAMTRALTVNIDF